MYPEIEDKQDFSKANCLTKGIGYKEYMQVRKSQRLWTHDAVNLSISMQFTLICLGPRLSSFTAIVINFNVIQFGQEQKEYFIS